MGASVQEGMRPFSWSAAPAALRDVPHRGQPDTYDFRFQLMSPLY